MDTDMKGMSVWPRMGVLPHQTLHFFASEYHYVCVSDFCMPLSQHKNVRKLCRLFIKTTEIFKYRLTAKLYVYRKNSMYWDR